MSDNHFMEGVTALRAQHKDLEPKVRRVKILNWYRNLYFRESNTTERGLMANVINSFFTSLTDLGVDLETMTLPNHNKSAVLQGLEDMRIYDGHGNGFVYPVDGVNYTVDQMIKEIKKGSEVGKKFERQIYDLTLTYMGKFSQEAK